MTSPPKLISLKVAAEQLDIEVTTLRRWITLGLLTAYRVGPRTLRVKPADVAALAQPLETEGSAGAVR